MPGPQQGSQQPPSQLSSVNNSPSIPGGGGMAPSATPAGESQQMNTLSLCKAGAETVQDIVTKTIELFSILKSLQV